MLVARDDGVRRQSALHDGLGESAHERRSVLVVDEVELVEHDDLRSLGEAAAMGRQLAVDRGIALAAVREGIVGLRVDRDHVHERVCPLEVREKGVPEPDAVGRALQQPRHVGHGELARVVQLDGAEMRRERRERVVRDLGRRVRDAAQERRLAGVREAEQRGVADHLEPQMELGRFAVLADLGRARRLAHRRREAPVAAPAAAAARDHDTRLGVREIGDRHLAVRVEHLRAERDVDDRVLAATAGLAPALAVHAALAAQMPAEAEGREVAHVRIGQQHDIAAVAAVAAVRAALGHELLAPEGDAAVTAATGLHHDGRAIVEVALAAHATLMR